jgi:hypothetical protein
LTKEFEDMKEQASHGEEAPPDEFQKMKSLSCAANVMRWTGRIWGLILIAVLTLVLFFWYMGSAGGAGPPGYVYLAGIIIVAGMIVAWQREGLGALISSVGLSGFYAALWAYDRSLFRYWGWVFIIILPPIAFLLTSSFLRRQMRAKLLEGQKHVDQL